MKCLLIEDNPLKREKISEYLLSFQGITISEASSYNSGSARALQEDFDLIILDMSMPTFDRTGETHGGRFRVLGGKDIAMKLAKNGRLRPFVVVTGYKNFSVNSETLSIEQINDSLIALGDSYKGYIIFDSAESAWKGELSAVIKGIA